MEERTRAAATYSWTREEVGEAVEAAMDCWPRLREAFVVAETPAEGSAAAGTWHVRLDSQGACRLARLSSAVVQTGALQQVAQALLAAVREK